MPGDPRPTSIAAGLDHPLRTTGEPAPSVLTLEGNPILRVLSVVMPVAIFGVLLQVYKFLGAAGAPQFRDTASAYFDALGESFLHGRLYLPDAVPAALLALANPYDPAQRNGIPATWPWDSSLYNGHLYLYWGPGTALVHAIWHLRFKSPLFEAQFGLGAGLISCLVFWSLLAQVRLRAFPRSSVVLVWGSVLAFGLGGMMPYLIGRPSVYHSPILLASLCLLVALYCLFKATERAAPRLVYLCLTGALLGGAIAARLTYVAYAIGIGLVLVLTLIKTRAQRGRAVRELTAFCAPILLTMVVLLGYNWLRFESPFEFGQRYQLAGTDQTHSAPTCGTNLLGYFSLYFLSVPRITPTYPFVPVDIGPSLVYPEVPPTVFPPAQLTQTIPQEPPLVSAFLLVPAAALVFSAPLLRWRGQTLAGAAAVLSATLLGVVAATGALTCAGGVDTRYFADLTLALSLAGAIVLLAWSDRLVVAHCSAPARTGLYAFAAAGWGLSIAIGLLLGTTAWYHWAPDAVQRMFGVTVH